jgi:hypothetical protein
MTIDEGRSHGKILCHPHQSVINRSITVGVIFTQYFPYNTGAFSKGAIM